MYIKTHEDEINFYLEPKNIYYDLQIYIIKPPPTHTYYIYRPTTQLHV